MHRSFTAALLTLFLFTVPALSQQVMLFEHAKDQDTVVVETGDYVHLEFKGYLGQSQGRRNNVLSFTEHSVFVDNEGMLDGATQYEIKTGDITGFRRMPRIQPALKPLANLSVALTTYLVLDKDDRFSKNEVLLYSTVMGLVINYGIDLLFPDDIEFKIADGWNIRIVPGAR